MFNILAPGKRVGMRSVVSRPKRFRQDGFTFGGEGLSLEDYALSDADDDLITTMRDPLRPVKQAKRELDVEEKEASSAPVTRCRPSHYNYYM